MTSDTPTSSPARRSADRPLLAIALRAAAMVMLSTMFMLAKLAGQHGVSLPELIFWRQAMSVPILLGVLLATGKFSALRTRRIKSHAARAVTGTVGLLCNMGAAILLPLPEATTLGFTTPLFAVIITAVLLREHVGAWRWTAVVLGFAGVLIVAQPGGAPIPPLGLVFGLGAGIQVAIISFQIRDLSSTEAPMTCVFWFAFFGAAMSSILLPFYARPHDWQAWMILGAIGVVGTLVQYLLTSALRFGQVATVVVMDYTALIWATTYGWGIWGTLPPHTTWLGAPLIIAAGLIITWREHYLSRRISPTSALDAGAIEEMRD